MASDQGSELLLTRLLGRSGVPTERLPVSPVVLWVGAFVFVDVVVLQAYKVSRGYPATFVTNPAWLVSPAVALLAAVATEYLHARYRTALDLIDVEHRTDAPERFERLAPDWLRVAVFVVGAAFMLWTGAVAPGIDRLLATGGVAEVVGTVLVAPLGYLPVFAEFVAAYLGITVFLPHAIRAGDFKVYFLDPEKLGGLRPIGELAKLTYYLMVVGLVGFLVFTYGPSLFEGVVSGYPEPDVVVNAAFTAVWVVAVATLAHALYVLHLRLKRERERELARLDDEARSVMEHPYDVHEWRVTDEERFADLTDRMEHVRATKEYPTTLAMWSQILVGLVLPKALQLVLAAL